jgi:hypothetical protein
VIDAMAKIPPALSLGQLHWGGSIQKCEAIEVEYLYQERHNSSLEIVENRHFLGKFLRFAFQPQPVFFILLLKLHFFSYE